MMADQIRMWGQGVQIGVEPQNLCGCVEDAGIQEELGLLAERVKCKTLFLLTLKLVIGWV